MRTTTFFFLLALATGCGPEDTGPEDTDDTRDTEDTDDTGDTDDEQTAAPEWSGSWEVEIAWSVTCDLGFGDTGTNEGTDTWTLQFQGPEDDLTVSVNGSDFFILRGGGDDEGFTICGDFPMYDHEGDLTRSGTQNEICLKGETVIGPEEVEGTASGPFESRFGADCELEDSPFILTK